MANRARRGQTAPNEIKHGQMGSKRPNRTTELNGTKRSQTGPNGAKWGQMGPNGAKHGNPGQMVSNGTKQGQTR